MEGQWSPGPYDPLHFCYWRQPHRFCRQEIDEPDSFTARLVVDYHLYTSCHDIMAFRGIADKHSFRTVQVFH